MSVIHTGLTIVVTIATNKGEITKTFTSIAEFMEWWELYRND